MRVVSFYSYKGGTGRTLLLANIALLAARLGKRVVAVDLDLEAPGLSYKLLGHAPEGDGLTGWLRDIGQPAADHGVSWRLIPVPVELPFVDGGELQLLPAGPPPSLGYLQLLRELTEQRAFDEGPAVEALLTLRETIEKELRPDLLLVDSRTGVTTTNAVINRVLADDIVALTLDTPEQLEGTRAVLRSLAPLTRPLTDEPLGLHVVLSRVPGRPAEVGSYELTDDERQVAAGVAQFLRAPTTPLAATLTVDEVHLLHEDPAVRAHEELLMARSDLLGSTALHVDYQRIARAVLGSGEIDGMISQALRSATATTAVSWTRFFGRETARVWTSAVPPSSGAAALAALDQARIQVGRWRTLVESDPSVLPKLAEALAILGIRCSQVGRRGDAVAPTEEAVELYRAQAADNPAYLPNLASALNNLGILYSEVGRRGDAVAPAEEAVTLRRAQAADNPAYLPNLASALNSLGIRYSEVGRRGDAVAPTEQAADLYRTQAADNPAYLPNLASALNNLGNRYSEVGRRDDAVAPTEQAADLYRAQAADNPAYLPNLATALNNLGAVYSAVGRRDDAVAPTEQAADLYRAQAADNPAYLPDLAGALNNLGIRYSEVGRRDDAVAPTEQAADLYRAQAADNPAYLPDLASALNNLGNRYSEVGRNADALAALDEAVAVATVLASDLPRRFADDLANSLRTRADIHDRLGNASAATADREAAAEIATRALDTR